MSFKPSRGRVLIDEWKLLKMSDDLVNEIPKIDASLDSTHINIEFWLGQPYQNRYLLVDRTLVIHMRCHVCET